MSWEVDWSQGADKKSCVLARNPTSHIRHAREWHRVKQAQLKYWGVNTPTYRADSWEVDWSKREHKKVWARNPMSFMPSAREWHWVDFKTLAQVGVAWRPKTEKKGRYLNGDGYWMVTPRGMTQEEVQLADKHNLWRGKQRTCCPEHRLVAIKKFGDIPPGYHVRHLNGNKADNSFENLVIGTAKENMWDHETARRMAMYWHNRFDEATREIERLRILLEQRA